MAESDVKSFNPQAFKYKADRAPRARPNEMRKSRVLTGNPDIRAVFTTQDGALNEANGRTEPVERVAAADLPCRVSYTSVKITEPSEEAARVGKSMTLYIDHDLDIPEGSKITVTQNGITHDYGRSGAPAVYTAYQEVPLQLWEGWA